VQIAVLNGPNLNLLGSREPEIYGTATLADLEGRVTALATKMDASVSWHQTNHEGEFIDLVQAAAGQADGALINAAAFTHTSMAIRDALLAVELPFVEVHLSNIFSREPERRRSLLADLAIGIMAGFGPAGYEHAFEALVNHLRGNDT
jgi:3-dehydroquinate dehydratase-2